MSPSMSCSKGHHLDLMARGCGSDLSHRKTVCSSPIPFAIFALGIIELIGAPVAGTGLDQLPVVAGTGRAIRDRRCLVNPGTINRLSVVRNLQVVMFSRNYTHNCPHFSNQMSHRVLGVFIEWSAQM